MYLLHRNLCDLGRGSPLKLSGYALHLCISVPRHWTSVFKLGSLNTFSLVDSFAGTSQQNGLQWLTAWLAPASRMTFTG